VLLSIDIDFGFIDVVELAVRKESPLCLSKMNMNFIFYGYPVEYFDFCQEQFCHKIILYLFFDPELPWTWNLA